MQYTVAFLRCSCLSLFTWLTFGRLAATAWGWSEKAHMARNWGLQPTASEELRPASNHRKELRRPFSSLIEPLTMWQTKWEDVPLTFQVKCGQPVCSEKCSESVSTIRPNHILENCFSCKWVSQKVRLQWKVTKQLFLRSKGQLSPSDSWDTKADPCSHCRLEEAPLGTEVCAARQGGEDQQGHFEDC